MGRGSSLGKLERLDQLIGKLKAGDTFTAGALAEELGVSLRTLMRDLDILRTKGFPIDSDRGRGGGIKLYSRWGIGRLTLNYREVIDLLLAMKVLEKLNSQLFLTSLESVRNKLHASFPDSQRPKIKLIRDRILIGELAPNVIMQDYSMAVNNRQNDSILESFFEQKCLNIGYRKKDGTISQRLIEIHFLYLSWPAWYLVCFDHLRNEPRMFRLDRIQSVKIIDEKFQTKKLNYFAQEFEQFSTPL